MVLCVFGCVYASQIGVCIRVPTCTPPCFWGQYTRPNLASRIDVPIDTRIRVPNELFIKVLCGGCFRGTLRVPTCTPPVFGVFGGVYRRPNLDPPVFGVFGGILAVLGSKIGVFGGILVKIWCFWGYLWVFGGI